MNTRIFHI